MHRQTESELIQHLTNQMRFLRSSSDSFDAGETAEAARLAVAIRVLVHDTRTSKSLLGQLGLKETLLFKDTALDERPGNLLSNDGLTMIQLGGAGGPIFCAPLSNLAPRRQNKPPKDFDDWWNATVIRDQQSHTFTRRTLVLALANKEGGAHVDPELEPEYVALSQSGSLGWVLTTDEGNRPLLESPVPASVRQIAYELEESIQNRNLLSDSS